MRRCPFAGCDAEIELDKFACRDHWHSLNEHDKARIGWGFREYRKGALSLEELRALQQKVLGERGKA